MSLFDGTAAYYGEYRPGIPAEELPAYASAKRDTVHEIRWCGRSPSA
jgi:hypothetical protein